LRFVVLQGGAHLGKIGFEEGGGWGGQVAGVALLAVAVEDGEEEGSGVQVHAGIESGVGGGKEAAHEGLRVRVMRREAAGCPLRAIAPPLRDSVRIVDRGLAADN
jgi:hypothetical protein